MIHTTQECRIGNNVEPMLAVKMKNGVGNENQRLEELVTKWTGHMKWRSDYKQWVIGRVWQEDRQKARSGELVEIFGDISGKKILDLGCGMGGGL